MQGIDVLLNQLADFETHPLYPDAIKIAEGITDENRNDVMPMLVKLVQKIKMSGYKQIFCTECGQEMLKETESGKCIECSGGTYKKRATQGIQKTQQQSFLSVVGTTDNPEEFASKVAAKLDQGYFCKDSIKQIDKQLIQFMQLKTINREGCHA